MKDETRELVVKRFSDDIALYDCQGDCPDEVALDESLRTDDYCNHCFADSIAPIIEAGAKKALLMNNSFEQIDIPDSIFYSTEARQAGFTKRSFLEAGWRKITLG